MEVLVTKTKSLDPNQQGLVPVGYQVAGVLVDTFGKEIRPDDIKSKGLQLRVKGTKFSERPFQFATESVQIVKEINNDYEVYTVSSIYLIQLI